MAAEAVLPPETALPAADPAIEASTDATDAAHWEAVARRTRSVASQWRKLHVNEEAKCEAARSTAARAINALRKAEDERDRAQRRAEASRAADWEVVQRAAAAGHIGSGAPSGGRRARGGRGGRGGGRGVGPGQR